MIYIEYSSQGKPISDFVLENEIQKIKSNYDHWCEVRVQYSTTNIFDMIMLAIAKQELDATKIMFRCNGVDISIKQDATVDVWPEDFLIDTAKIYEEILNARMGYKRLDKQF